MHDYEVEIKTLLGSKENAEALLTKMRSSTSDLKEKGEHKQLNHYFTSGDLSKLAEGIAQHFKPEDQAKLRDLVDKAKDYSLRTRDADGKIIFVLKATVDDTTSSNGIARIEFEATVDMTLDELDKLILNCGFRYQAKWSRERQEFSFKGLNVTIDKNAGYGYLAEFEKVIDDPAKVDETKTSIHVCMQELGVDELPQDRLARMFDYYNANWQDYYGTDKVLIFWVSFFCHILSL